MMKSLVSRSVLSIIVCIVLVLSVACGNTVQKQTDTTAETTAKVEETIATTVQNEAINISALTSQSRFKPIMKKMAEQLKADENVTVDFQVLPDDQWDNSIKLKISTGEVPDVMDLNIPANIQSYGVDKFVDLSDQPWIARLSNPELLKVDGKIYGLPKESSSAFVVCYYNKKVMDDLGIKDPKPATYADFIAILEKIKASGNGIIPFYASNKDTWTTQIFMTNSYSIAAYPNEKDIYSKLLENKLKWSDVPEFKKVLSDYLDLYKKGYVNKDHLTATYDMAKEAVATGKAAMMLNGEWCVSDIMAKWPDTQLGSFAIPVADKQMICIGNFVSGLSIPSNGKNIENAKKFINLWSQVKYQNMFWSENPGFPGLKDVDGGTVNAAVKNVVDTYVMSNQYAYEMNSYFSVCGPILGDLFNEYVSMTAGSKTPDQVLKAWDNKYSDFMKQKQQPGF
jgi:raffinose/stachyose/melibiose transport system substrate-binding protein